MRSQHKRALIVVDVQNDFCPGGSLGVERGHDVAAEISQHLAENRESYDAILATQDWHKDPGSHFSDTPDHVDSWPVHCVAETTGAALHPKLAEFPFDAVFTKGEYSAAYSGFEGACQGETLAAWLRERGVDKLDVVGTATDFCVQATVLDALKEGFAVRVFSSLCAPVAAAGGKRALEVMAEAGAEVVDEAALSLFHSA